MRIIGLTGGIGSGKSTVAKIFSVMGIPVYNADEKARNLMDHDPDVKREVLEIVGSESLALDGSFDKRKIASLVFTNKDLLNRLNGVIHPAVRKDFNEWVKQQAKAAYFIKEAAVLFESGAYKGVDKIICVTAPEKIRIERVMKRDKTSAEDVIKRIANQWPEEEKIAKSDFVIVNDGDTALIPQALSIHHKLINE